VGIDFAKLRAEIRSAARASFTEVRDGHPDETFYAFALSTDDGVMSIGPGANSEEAFQRTAGSYGYSDPADLAYLRWSTAEWAYEGAGGKHFRAVYDLLNGPSREDDEKDFAAFKVKVLAAMVEGLRDLDASGFFGSGDARGQITLFVALSDSDMSPDVEDDSAQKLNPAPVYARFAARYR
jgi:hypothetical protein